MLKNILLMIFLTVLAVFFVRELAHIVNGLVTAYAWVNDQLARIIVPNGFRAVLALLVIPVAMIILAAAILRVFNVKQIPLPRGLGLMK